MILSGVQCQTMVNHMVIIFYKTGHEAKSIGRHLTSQPPYSVDPTVSTIMIGQKNKRNSLRRSSRRAMQATLTYPEVIVRSVEMTSVSRRDISSSISNNTYNRYLLEKQQKIELVWFQKKGKKSTLAVGATSPTPAVFNVTKGLSDKQWQSIQGEMPGNMTREDFNETCNTILLWVKEAVGTAVKPALDLTWEIITTNGSSILSIPSSCSRTEECSVVICPFPSSSRSKSALLDEVDDEHEQSGSTGHLPLF
ncbi:uncharacterized protein LOC129829912 isoform X2 [Salvelinus fontinalis]|uniref:uncharacterized protein LOC129829912 isoform X2 n=2 Tax=Salvelinus fontinalis TaxID=8038 RepID=UPI0024854A22|nr:uncharacterized protein LOC129829912 isoform X2 [Salvelinus fontinalis]